jgi:hypothetical protein
MMKNLVHSLIVSFTFFLFIDQNQLQASKMDWASFTQLPYERFVSLGNCCATRTQINHHLSHRFGLDSSAFGGGQLFDWIVIHDYNKFASALENNLMDFFEKRDLLLVPRVDIHYPSVMNLKYWITWNHLFTRRSDASIDFNIIEKEFHLKKVKINYLSQKFKALKNYRTLYILAYPFADNLLVETIEPDRDTIIRLRNALLHLRGNANFTLLFCPLVKRFENFENVLIIPIINPPGVAPNVGDYNYWNQMLNYFPFSLKKLEFDMTKNDQIKFTD